MSHVISWTCRSCRAVLGHVRDGVLRPVAAVESVDGWGVARIPCPTCRRVRAWLPSLAMPAHGVAEPPTGTGGLPA